MPRLLPAACLFLGAAMLASLGSAQQPEKKQPAKGKFDPPAALKPDEATIKSIQEKMEQLRARIAALKARKVPDDVIIEIEIYLKAAENIVRFDEWFAKDSVKWTLTTLNFGLERANQASDGKAEWRASPGQWVVRAYRSSIDGSIQPYAVLLPADYGEDPKKRWRLDVVLHGRDSSLTEAKFLATHDRLRAAPKALDHVQLEIYGRGNNAYRWAGESDVTEAFYRFINFRGIQEGQAPEPIDLERVVLRGFSMGGAGTWHLGLHHPFDYAVIGPGAGFTTTHGYVGGLPAKLPEHQEKCLRIYDAVNYAENAFNVPIVAYSGEIDDQKKAADNIEARLKEFKEPVKFTHLVAPGLPHTQPPEWQARCEAEYKKHLGEPKFPERVRFVTYTPRYSYFLHGSVEALETTYEKAVVDSKCTPAEYSVKTTNVAALSLVPGEHPFPREISIDGQKLGVSPEARKLFLVKSGRKWSIGDEKKWRSEPHKRSGLQGPIDDAFMDGFVVVPPSGSAPFAAALVKQFAFEWDKYFRGALPIRDPARIAKAPEDSIVLFGDPQSNPLIAAALPRLPIKWTAETLTVNGVDYDAKTHLPVMIYPNPASPNRYLVLNSGHTFREADLKGTNALLYPRLGDWAVIKPAPTAKDPAAYEVVAAGLFDENWQFPKK